MQHDWIGRYIYSDVLQENPTTAVCCLCECLCLFVCVYWWGDCVVLPVAIRRREEKNERKTNSKVDKAIIMIQPNSKSTCMKTIEMSIECIKVKLFWWWTKGKPSHSFIYPIFPQLLSTPFLILRRQTDGIFGLFESLNRLNIWCGCILHLLFRTKMYKTLTLALFYFVVFLMGSKKTPFSSGYRKCGLWKFRLCEQRCFSLILFQKVAAAAAFISPDLECTRINLLTSTNESCAR